MSSNRLAFAAVALACIAAAAGGGYLAMKQNVAPQPVAATAAPSGQASASSPAATAPAAAPGQPVRETEGSVAEAAKTRAEHAAPAPSARRSETPATRTPATSPAGARPARPADVMLSRQAPPPLDRTFPADATTMPPPPPMPVVDPSATSPGDDPSVDALPPQEPAEKVAEELTIPADSVIGLQTETTVSSDLARVEDRVEARVTRDVRIGDAVAIPAGSRAIGSVTQVDRGGKFKERARLGVRFHTLVLADHTRLPISTETIFRESEAPGNTAASKIGGASVGGAILGAILGGARGAAIGAAAGAGAGTAAVAAGDRNVATLPAGMPMTVRLLSPVTVTIDK